MSLRPGDTVSLSIRPPVQLSRYQFIKASATVTRTLGDDPEADLVDMRGELRRVFFTTLHDELTLTGEVTALIQDGDVTELARYALKKSKTHAAKKDRRKEG